MEERHEIMDYIEAHYRENLSDLAASQQLSPKTDNPTVKSSLQGSDII